MALQVNAGSDLKRTDAFLVDPNQIIVREEWRGRFMPPSEQDIIRMAVSLLDNGQRQPVECRRDNENRLILTAGFTRTAAVRLIRDGFTDTTGQKRVDPGFMLAAIVRDANDETAFIRNVIENAHRSDTSPIDDAHNHDALRTKYGKTDAEIAALYQYSDHAKVSRYRKLLLHPKSIQRMIHDGVMPVQAALDLLDLPEAERDNAIAAAVNAQGKVNGSAIRKQVRDKHLNDNDKPADVPGQITMADAPTAKKPKTKARSIKEVREYLEQLAAPVKDDSDTRTPKMIELAQAFRWFVTGARSEKFLTETIERLVAKK